MADAVPDLDLVASPPRRDLSYDDISVGDRIGSGGQAVIRAARLPDTEQPPSRVALREPGAGGETLSRDRVESFLDRVETWKTLDERERQKPRWADSEHIVGIVDTGDQLPWVAMEFMDGGNLADRLESESRGLALAEALWIGESVARGVELAHNYGVAHLDLKPENVLFRRTPDGTWDVPKLGDWGLARTLVEQTGTVEGISVEYAAPEQFEPDRFGDPDMLTDVYQLGAILYALVTGRPPYTGGQLSVMNSVLTGDPPRPPAERRGDVPEQLSQLICRCLARDKTDRYRSVASLVEDLVTVRELDIERATGHRQGGTGSESTDGRDLKTKLTIDLETAYYGTETEVMIRRPEPCEECNGQGYPPGTGSKVCPECSGRGQTAGIGQTQQRPTCGCCGGEGTIYNETCSTCHGDGVVLNQATLTVEIPAGIEDAQTLRLSGEGAPGEAGARNGDLLIEIEIEDHPEFERDGGDLVKHRSIPPSQAASGQVIEVETIDRTVEFDLPGGTQSGDTFRLSGLGMPHLREEGYGDLYVVAELSEPH